MQWIMISIICRGIHRTMGCKYIKNVLCFALLTLLLTYECDFTLVEPLTRLTGGVAAYDLNDQKQLSRMLNGKDTYGSINREELYSSSGGYKNRNSWAPNQYEAKHTREDTRSLLRQQEQMMAKQDQDLSELSKGIGDLKNIGVAIGEGLTSALLDDIGKVSIKPMEPCKKGQRRQNSTKQVQGNCGLYVIIFLLIILLVFNISSHGFKNL